MSDLSHCFQEFSMFSVFRIYAVICLGVYFFGSILYVQLPECIGVYDFCQTLGTFQSLFLQVLCSPILFLLSFWDSKDRNLFFFF